MPAATSSRRSILTRRDESLRRPVAERAGWGDVDIRAVDTLRVLAADAVQNVGNGHPGTAMALAPAAYLLFQNVMVHDPSDPEWLGRDRFVLSCGHSSLTLYGQLYFSGYGLEIEDFAQLRTFGSRMPGHPEIRHTPGVEITTGPLGSGLASAVGMAMAQRRQRGLLDPDAAPGESPFDHRIYVLASDGDIQEGVSHEASSLAGHQELDNLVVIYDQNQISIDDDTRVALSEDVEARYRAYGWHVQTVDWRRDADGGGYVEDVDALLAALDSARETHGQPSLIVLRTIIAWPAPAAQDTGAAHGAALGGEEVAAIKDVLGFPTDQSFVVEPDVLAHVREVRTRGAAARAAWEERLATWRSAQPDRAELLDRLQAGRLPDGWRRTLPRFASSDKPTATRVASGKVLAALAPVLPELWGGSADLMESNAVGMPGEPSFVPLKHQTATWHGNPTGRLVHFGVREFAMGCALNGIAMEQLTRPYGATFLIFSDYMRPAVRLAALQQLPVTFVWTHDSIGVGEDGPTHQPVEQIASLRAVPGLDVIRPADANETVEAWAQLLVNARPAGLALTRQAVPVIDRDRYAAAEGTSRGAYVLAEAGPEQDEAPEVILVATGSEVAVALAARELLEGSGVRTRVVSMPCREWFDRQPASYRDEVLPPHVRARVSIEAGVAQGWREIVGDAGRCVSLEHFGESAASDVLFNAFGFTPQAVASAARASLTAAGAAAAVAGALETLHRPRR